MGTASRMRSDPCPVRNFHAAALAIHVRDDLCLVGLVRDCPERLVDGLQDFQNGRRLSPTSELMGTSRAKSASPVCIAVDGSEHRAGPRTAECHRSDQDGLQPEEASVREGLRDVAREIVRPCIPPFLAGAS